MNINDLPDLILRTIFSKLPPVDLFRLDLICPYWAQLQPSVCCKVDRLNILIGKFAKNTRGTHIFAIPHLDELQDFKLHNSHGQFSTYEKEWYKLEFAWLDKKSVHTLGRLFCNVTHVQISVEGILPWILIGELSRGQRLLVMNSIIDLISGKEI